MARVLVVDDERDILDLVALNLKRVGIEASLAEDGLTALDLAKKQGPDLIVLDLMLPGMDGFTVYKNLRKDARTRSIPVLMLTARGQQGDKITGLEMGADDYVTKPFSPRELVLRVQNLLKRSKKIAAQAELHVGEFHLDAKNLKVYLAGKPLDLTTTEFKLLTLLVENTDVTQKRGDLLSEVWGYSDEVHTRTLDTHVKRVREKLGEYSRCIETVRGEGYRFTLKSVAAV
ncbi:MAG: response regulator transcription factor [Verrucomicrobiota bacterium]